MFDYKANPFYLNDNEIKWVEDTYEGMSLEEKLGQLFCPIVFTKDEKELKELVQEKHIEKDQEKNCVRHIKYFRMLQRSRF